MIGFLPQKLGSLSRICDKILCDIGKKCWLVFFVTPTQNDN